MDDSNVDPWGLPPRAKTQRVSEVPLEVAILSSPALGEISLVHIIDIEGTHVVNACVLVDSFVLFVFGLME